MVSYLSLGQKSAKTRARIWKIKNFRAARIITASEKVLLQSHSILESRMPTYIVTAPQGRLSAVHKIKLADDITRVHCDITGAPSYFAQVIFHDVPGGNYFVGGKALKDVDHVYLHGTIRAGRDASTKERMLVELMRLVSRSAQMQEHCVQVYLSEIPARQVLEFGKILPLPGEEAAWFDSIPEPLRDRLVALGN